MTKIVIEPSEILTGKGDSIHRLEKQPNPWLRLIARFFDYALFFTILYFIPRPPSWPSFGKLVPIEFFAWIPFEALLLAFCGTTPGKWLVGVDVKVAGKKLCFKTALKRSLNVWFRGLGMGIPIINVICMMNAYYRMRLFQATSWDLEDDIAVIYRPVGKWRVYLAAAAAAIGMIFYSFWK